MIGTIAEWLSQDVAVLGGLYSPLLSWIGSAGLIVFTAWQAMRLYAGIHAAQALCSDIEDVLARLLKERRATHRDPLARHDHTLRSTPLEQTNSRDSDDLGVLDRLMDLDPAMSQAWAQYRKTLVLEHVAWFQEPRIFSTRHAEECFTLDRLFARRIHYAWFNHVPSFVTVHQPAVDLRRASHGAESPTRGGTRHSRPAGIDQRLGGKFLTSIVGLVCANSFSLLEKRVSMRVVTAHQTLVDSLEGLFPRKMLGQWLEQQSASSGAMKGTARNAGRPDLEYSIQNLGLIIQDLAVAVKTQALALEIGADAGDNARTLMTPVPPVERGRFRSISGIPYRP